MVTLDAHFDLKISNELRDLIREAASLQGQSVDDYVASALTEMSQRVVQQRGPTVLSDRDRDIFLDLLDSVEEPNEALRQAAKRFRGQNG